MINKNMNKKILKCDAICDDEKHGKPKYMCPECESVFCKECSFVNMGSCFFCEPPALEEIKNKKNGRKQKTKK
jgi:hypothetical protein